MLAESRVQEVHVGSKDAESMSSVFPLSCNSPFEDLSRDVSTPSDRLQSVAMETIRSECNSYIAVLVHLLHDANPDVRAFAVDPLSRSGSSRAPELLLQLLRDGDSSVRNAAVVALGNLHERRAIRPLTALLETEDDENVILSTLDALAHIGSGIAAGGSLPTLDKDEEVVVETVAEFLSLFQGISGIMPQFNRCSHRLTHDLLENSVVQALLQIVDRRKQGNLSDDLEEQLTSIFEKIVLQNSTSMRAIEALQKLRATNRFLSHPEHSWRQP